MADEARVRVADYSPFAFTDQATSYYRALSPHSAESLRLDARPSSTRSLQDGTEKMVGHTARRAESSTCPKTARPSSCRVIVNVDDFFARSISFSRSNGCTRPVAIKKEEDAEGLGLS